MFYPCFAMHYLVSLILTQQAHNLKTTSYQRQCDVMTSHRRRYDVVLTACACWEGLQVTISKLSLLHKMVTMVANSADAKKTNK